MQLTRWLIPVLILGVVACCASAAYAYEGPVWGVGESEIEGKVTIKSASVGVLTFQDTKAKVKLECKATGKGAIGIKGSGEITELATTACKVLEGTCGSPAAKAIHLPWHTQLNEAESAVRESISSGGGGAPGWNFECFGVVSDTCTGETTTAAEDVSGGVDLVFDAKSTRTSCTIGGAETGVAGGTDIDENPPGESLTVDPQVGGAVGNETFGPGKPFYFAVGETSRKMILRNTGPLRRQYLNGTPDVPGAISANPTNFSVKLVAAKPCGEGLAGLAECEVEFKSVLGSETGEYLLLYGNAANELELKFALISL